MPQSDQSVRYYEEAVVQVPSRSRTVASRLAFPLLALLSRDRSARLGLVPIDDERVIMALTHAQGRVLDIGCGANNFVRSYGNGVGADVMKWEGCDLQIEDAAKLPFRDESFGTVSYLACLNHIPNREDSVRDGWRVLLPGGRILVTMITPTLGRFIHWLRRANDPDHFERHIEHDHELLGMSESLVRQILEDAGFRDVVRKRFVMGLNSLYVAVKP
jgi:SAM-dependent methyltransferase